MEKVLSICVPSYNMEQYLARNIESFLVKDCLDKIEIIVVNDGSKDGTLKIANGYKEKYPDTIVVIDKINGHYGSCVNAALKVATGKYFRIVDADDFVDAEGLKKLVTDMEKLDVDCIYTQFAKICDGKLSVVDSEIIDLPYNKELYIDQVKLPKAVFHMHCLSYRTQLLRDIKYVQTEGICYTDTEYVYYPLINCKTIYLENFHLYCYLVGRDEQSVDIKSLRNNYFHFQRIHERITQDCHILLDKNRNYLYDFYMRVLLGYMFEISVFINPIKCNQIDLRCRISNLSPNLKKYLYERRKFKLPVVKMWMRNSLFDKIIITCIQAYHRYLLK